MLCQRRRAALDAPTSHTGGCGREVITWDYWSEQLGDGIWRATGTCRQQPAPYTVVEHCLKCERLRTSHWCAGCVDAYLDEQHQQLCNGDRDLLWCLGCQHFTLQWRVVTAEAQT